MTDELQEPETPLNPVVVESTGDDALDRRLAQPILKGDRGIDAAQVWISAFLIVVAGVIAYSNTLGLPFHADDRSLIVDNQALHHPTSFAEALDPRFPRPVTMASLALNCWLSPNSPVLFHAVNLLIHLLNGILIFLLCRRLLAKGAPESVAMLAGLLFVLNPVNTEAVNYVVGRAHLLSTFFSLCAVLLYLRACQDETRLSYGAFLASVLCFVCAWGSRETGLLLPLLLLTVEWTLRGGDGLRKRLVVHVPYWALLTAFLAVRYATRGTLGVTMTPRDLMKGGATFWQYLTLMVNPSNLAVDHGAAPLAAAGGAIGLVAAGLLLLALLGSLGRRSVLGFIGVFFFAELLPSIFMNPTDIWLSERRLYAATAALGLVVPWLFGRKGLGAPFVRVTAGLVAAALVIGGGVATFMRNGVWQDELTLWQDAAAKTPSAPKPYRVMGAYYLAQARQAMAGLQTAPENQREQAGRDVKGQLGEAANNLRTAVKLDPEHGETLYNFGVVLDLLGKQDEAVDSLAHALRLDSGSPLVTVALAMALDNRAHATGSSEDQRRALDCFRRADELAPLPPDAAARYGLDLAAVGKFDEAARVLQQVVGEDAQSPLAQALKDVQAKLQLIDSNVPKVMQRLSQDPRDPEGLKVLGQLFLLAGRYQQALYVANLVLQQQPEDLGAWIQMGVAQAGMKAPDAFLAECPIPPSQTTGADSPWHQLALTCGSVGLWDGALHYLHKAPDSAGLPTPLLAAADVALQLKQGRRAWEFLRQATEALPNDPAPWLRLCDMAIAGKDSENAQRFLAEAERRNASAADVNLRREQLGGPPAAPPLQGTVRTIIQ